MTKHPDEFELYDLKVEVIKADGRPFVCSHVVGEVFTVSGENLQFGKDTQFSFYALAAIIPLLAAKQRETDKLDWMSSDDIIACPDPNCGGQFKITRLAKRTFRRSETTVTERKHE